MAAPRYRGGDRSAELRSAPPPNPYMRQRCDAAMGNSDVTKNRRVPTPWTPRRPLLIVD
jgi:hypothetical protein